MIEIKHDGSRTSITGNGTAIDVVVAYARITCAVGRTVLKMTGEKELTDTMMASIWTANRKYVFGEEREDA